MLNKTLKLSLATMSLMACSHAGGLNAFAGETIKNTPLHNMKFDVSPEGVGFAALQGDRFKESYMAMVRLPAGTDSPPHIKTANMFGIIISGAMIHTAVDANASDKEVVLTPGSYYMIPADLLHVSRCVSEVECVTFLYQDGKFDFNVVTE